MEINKEKYIRFCKSNSVPLFLQPWWMDAVCKKNARWEVFLYEEQDEIRGVFVCYFVSKMGLKMILQPQLTQYNGVWLVYDDNASSNEKIHFEKKALSNLLLQLKNLQFDYFNQSFPLNFSNWLPFYWQGFSQTTRYTYQINDISDPEKCFRAFGRDKKMRINKAQKHLSTIKMTGEAFYDHLTQYRMGKKERVLFSKEFFLKLHDAAVARNQGKIIAVADSNDDVHAAVFLVWDSERCYNLMTTINPTYNSFGGSSFMINEAIRFMSDKVKVFDFEGSMAENIESSFSRFGTTQRQYFNITKYNSPLARLFFEFIRR